MPTLKLTVFGSPQLELNGTPAQLATRKALALLAYLAVNQQAHSRETLAALFWPEFSSDRAFANLREALRLLKHLLTNQWLTIQRYDVALRPDAALWVDVHEFQQLLHHAESHEHAADTACANCLPSLMTAIDLYQDDFLHGFTLPDCPGFDEWHAFQTDLFREKLIASFTRIIHYSTSLQNFAQAVQYARQWVRRCAWSEAAHRELMRLYALNHQRSAALHQYQECARMLQEEFGAKPEQQTTELYEAILHQTQPSDGRAESVRTLKRPLESAFLDKPPPEGALASLNSQTGGLAPGSGEDTSPPHNLPAQTTSFIGRETEIAAVKHLLSQPDVRLVTLTGAGGSGKTRLSLHVAAQLLNAYADGVFVVSLAPISTPDLLPSAIVQTLGLQVVGNTPPLEVVKGYLHQKQLLLILDNFEQILEAAPTLIHLLSAAPDVKILVTSRTVLRVSGEHEYLVPPLKVPDPEDVLSFRDSTQSEAVQLFVERARAVKQTFTLTEENAPAVAGMCIRLDGLPLAIELAAARLRMFSPQMLLARLSSPLQFLTGGARDLPSRQRTIRGTIAWSYDLLDEEEKTLFHRLAVFVGGWTLDAAETVCAIAGDPLTSSGQVLAVLPGVESLLDKSLVNQVEGQGERRFVMLETIREYALERLTECGEAETILRQHAQYFLELAETTEPRMHLVEQLNRVDAELDNVRGALAWSLDHAKEIGVRLAAALGEFWIARAYFAEGRGWLMKALAHSHTDDPHLNQYCAKILCQAGRIAYLQGDFTVASGLLKESETLYRALDDLAGLSRVFCWQGICVRYSSFDFTSSRVLLEKSLALCRQIDDTPLLVKTLHNYGNVLEALGDDEQAELVAKECLVLAQSINDLSAVVDATTHLGSLALARNEYKTAQALYEKSLELSQNLAGKDRSGFSYWYLGRVFYAQKQDEQALAYYTDALKIFQEINIEWVRLALEGAGYVLLRQQRWREAYTHFANSLKGFQRREHSWGRVSLLTGFAGVAEGQGQEARAARLLGAVERFQADPHGWIDSIFQYEYGRIVTCVRRALGEDAFENAFAKGRDMMLDEVFAYALAGQPEEDT